MDNKKDVYVLEFKATRDELSRLVEHLENGFIHMGPREVRGGCPIANDIKVAVRNFLNPLPKSGVRFEKKEYLGSNPCNR